MRKTIALMLYLSFLPPAYSGEKLEKFITNDLYEQVTSFCSYVRKEKVVLHANQIKTLQNFEKNNLLYFLLYRSTLNQRNCFVKELKESGHKKSASKDDWEFIDYMHDMNQVFHRTDPDLEEFNKINKALKLDKPFQVFDIYYQVYPLED